MKLLNYELDYLEYLKISLNNIRATHGGYFSQDNAVKDEIIEKEINEIIHDKEKLIDVSNARRFIFSKWTLREGWDNPNVFQIVKLRTSGSETSKLQEVGRGLRIPVNEYMERVKEEQFELHYFVDFTEKDFVDTLTNEINGFNGTITYEFNDNIQEMIFKYYPEDFENLLDMKSQFLNSNIINGDEKFTAGGYDLLKEKYPLIIQGIKKGKVKNANDTVKTVGVRTENYNKLKELWEHINQKVIIEYKFTSENQVKLMLLEAITNTFECINDIIATSHSLNKVTGTFVSNRSLLDINQSISTLKYGEFIKLVSKDIGLNIETIHNTFISLKVDRDIDINDYLNMETVRTIKQAFNEYLITNVDVKYQIAYNSINNKIHPTTLTDVNGVPLSKINASNVGTSYDTEINVSDKYLYDTAFYDSNLEMQNIDIRYNNEISEIVVYAKIPKGSVRIPIVGGFSYSPDFAYVVKYENGSKELNLVIETKGKKESDLSTEENNRIKLAEKLYSGDEYSVKFERQMSNKKMSSIITEVLFINEKGQCDV